jgi:hypothetical protein
MRSILVADQLWEPPSWGTLTTRFHGSVYINNRPATFFLPCDSSFNCSLTHHTLFSFRSTDIISCSLVVLSALYIILNYLPGVHNQAASIKRLTLPYKLCNTSTQFLSRSPFEKFEMSAPIRPFARFTRWISPELQLRRPMPVNGPENDEVNEWSERVADRMAYQENEDEEGDEEDEEDANDAMQDDHLFNFKHRSFIAEPARSEYYDEIYGTF